MNTVNFDRRKTWLCGVDTETCNGIMEGSKLNLDFSLVYDIGWSICDKKGNVLTDEFGKPITRSYVIYETFVGMKDVMQSAYYASKIPMYWEDIQSGKRELVRFFTMRKVLMNDLETYGVSAVFAHNARFDHRALNNTIRYITKSKFRYFFPKETEIWDTLKMARDVITKMPTYVKFCNEYNLLTPKGKIPANAQALYAFLTRNPDYQECHTGLEDVMIEKEIMAYCFRQHKKMRKKLYENA